MALLHWHLSYARGYLQLGLFPQAEEELAQVPAAQRDRPDVLEVELLLYHEWRRWPELAAAADRLRAKHPAIVQGWVSSAYAVRRFRSLAEARAILEESLAHHPGEAIVRFNLACYACQLGDLPEARTRLAEALALDPAYADLAATEEDLAPLRAAGC